MSYQVVIIGAGISGLYAACNLIDLGIKDILILEAQNRIGGRMHSIQMKIPKENDKNEKDVKWIELGAQFCHGSYDNHLYNFCKNNKIPLLHATEEYPNTYECGFHFFTAPEGNLISPKAIPCAKLAEEIAELLNDEEMSNEIFISENDFSVGHHFWSKFQEWHPKSKAIIDKYRNHTTTEQPNKDESNMLSSSEIVERIYYFLINELRDDNGCENLNDLSVRSWCEFEDDYDEDCEDSDDEYQVDCHFKNGARSVLDVLTDKISSDNIEIRVSTPLLKISNWNNQNKIKLSCGDEQNPFHIEADHVICTAPLGYLKANYKTMFDPPLPIEKEKALDSVSFGSICKVFLEFENPLPKHLAGGFCLLWPKSVVIDEWKEYGENSESIIFDRTNWYRQLFMFHKVVERPSLLLGWISGRAAIACEKLKDEEILEDIKKHIFEELIHNGNHHLKFPDVKAVHISRWNSNQYIRGTYSYRTIYADMKDISPKNLAEPLLISKVINEKEVKCPRVLFAGEATDFTRYGTMDGAMQSGKREAKRIHDYLKSVSNHTK